MARRSLKCDSKVKAPKADVKGTPWSMVASPSDPLTPTRKTWGPLRLAVHVLDEGAREELLNHVQVFQIGDV